MRHAPETQARIDAKRRDNYARLSHAERQAHANAAPSLHTLVAGCSRAQLVRALKRYHEHVATCVRLGTVPERPEVLFRDALQVEISEQGRQPRDGYDAASRDYSSRYTPPLDW